MDAVIKDEGVKCIPWFSGDRVAAEALLKEKGPNTYLFRSSKNQQESYVCSIWDGQNTRHYVVEKGEAGFHLEKHEQNFESLEEFIKNSEMFVGQELKSATELISYEALLKLSKVV